MTDLFTHWIDVVHMFMGHDIPFAASAAGGVYQYKDGRTAPDTINVLLEYPQEYTATFEATLVQLLVKIVSRGGNFLLNVGPSPDGLWDDTVYSRLKEIGAWLRVNGEGIYGSRTIAPWSSGNVYLTQSRDSSDVYAFFLGEGKDVVLPAEVTIEKFTARPKSRVTILGRKENAVKQLQFRAIRALHRALDGDRP